MADRRLIATPEFAILVPNHGLDAAAGELAVASDTHEPVFAITPLAEDAVRVDVERGQDIRVAWQRFPVGAPPLEDADGHDLRPVLELEKPTLERHLGPLLIPLGDDRLDLSAHRVPPVTSDHGTPGRTYDPARLCRHLLRTLHRGTRAVSQFRTPSVSAHCL